MEINNFEKINKIIAKVRAMYKYDKEIKEIVSHNAHVNVYEKSKGKLEFSSISFNWYDSVVVTDEKIIYKPEHGSNRVLMEYKNWDELLGM